MDWTTRTCRTKKMRLLSWWIISSVVLSLLPLSLLFLVFFFLVERMWLTIMFVFFLHHSSSWHLLKAVSGSFKGAWPLGDFQFVSPFLVFLLLCFSVSQGIKVIPQRGQLCSLKGHGLIWSRSKEETKLIWDYNLLTVKCQRISARSVVQEVFPLSAYVSLW